MLEAIIVIFALQILFFIWARIIEKRAVKASAFMRHLLSKMSEWDIRHMEKIISGEESSSFEWFDIPDYDELIYGFGKLDLFAHCNVEQLRKLSER